MQAIGYPPSTNQLQDPLRIRRRQLDPEDILDIIRRNRSWVAGPTLAGLVIAVVTAFLWPDTYESTAVIRVVPPQVPSTFVPTNVTTQMSQRVSAMAQTILSRGTLTSIIETYNLYPRQRQSMPLEDVIERMRRVIVIGDVRNIRPGRGTTLTAFQIDFSYENRYLAQKVTSDLVTRFINENTRERANQSAMTTQFLRDQWQAAKNDLDEIEQKLTEFRIRNAGQLPGEWGSNMQQAAALETRAASVNGMLGRLQQEKLVLEAEIRALRDRIGSMAKSSSPAAGFADPRQSALEEQIRTAERALAALLKNYTPSHPDVKRYEAQVEVLRKQREDYLAGRSVPESTRIEGPSLTAEQAAEIRAMNAQVQEKQIRVKAKDLEIETATREMEGVNARIARLQERIQQAPVGEQEYTALMRDYELRQKRYDDLNLKMAQSEIATDLENRKQGEKLELLDPASLPERPTKPIRSLIILVGLVLGFGVSGVLVFLREIKDASLKTLKDVRAYTQLTILGSIPLLENDLVVLRRRRMAWLAWTTAGLFAAAAMAGSIYYYYVTKI